MIKYEAHHGPAASHGWRVYESTRSWEGSRIVARGLEQRDAERIARLLNLQEEVKAKIFTIESLTRCGEEGSSDYVHEVEALIRLLKE